MNPLILSKPDYSTKQCSGCSACMNICPKSCIEILNDNEGFYVPVITNHTSCINCNLCKTVCPPLNEYEKQIPIRILGAYNTDKEARLNSSSGGIFHTLATDIIKNGGVVFGALFNEKWDVVIDYAEDIEKIREFQGSKYVQSFVGDSYKKAKEYLNDGRIVLFSGLPCQIAGLNHYLGKHYTKLYTIECICHSAPSPLVWKKFKEHITHNRIIENINFRDKTYGWREYSLIINYKNDCYDRFCSDNPYLKGMIENLTTRRTCSDCRANFGRSKADISIGDYWGINIFEPHKDDNKGASIIKIYTQKGMELFERSSAYTNSWDVNPHNIKKYNLGLKDSTPMHKHRSAFFRKVNRTDNVINLIKKELEETKVEKIRKYIRYILSI